MNTDAFTHRRLYTQTLLHTGSFTHTHTHTLCAQTFVHTEALTHKGLTHRHVYIQMLLHTKRCAGPVKIAILPQFLPIEPRFVRKGCGRYSKIAILPQFFTIEPRFVRKGCISWRLVGTAPRLKREIKKKEREEGKRARGQESKTEKM